MLIKRLLRIDSVTLLLSFFIIFVIALFLYLFQLNNHIQKFSTQNNTINELKILNKNFNNFLLQQAVFINYDEINKDTANFKKKIKVLEIHTDYLNDSQQYNQLAEKVIKFYEKKVENIEYFKSQSSQLLYSMHYLFDLNEAILKSTSLSENSVALTNKILLKLMKFYINPNIEHKELFEDLNKLKNIDDIYVKLFFSHITLNLQRIEKFHKIKNIQDYDDTALALDEMHLFLSENYKKDILTEKTIVAILFVVALLILFILIYMNKYATKIRNELIGFKTAIENSYNSIVITDIDSNITYVNDIAINETGYSKEELIGQNPRVLKSGQNDDSFYQEMHTALSSGRKWEGEFINKKKDGSLLYEKASIMPIYQDDEIVNYLAIKLNITDYIDEKNKVQHMAYHDSLTQLPNRLNIEQYLQKRVSIAKRSQLQIAILFIDLDRFKIINDTLGHDVGDELLVQVSLRLKSALRESDMLARVGGDEFIIVIESPTQDYSAAYVSQKILDLFTKPIKTQNNILNITLSIGISLYPDDDKDYKKLFKYADIAMYKAKDSGKNTYRYYQKQLSIDAHNRLDIEQALKSALNNSEIYMVYQAKYDLNNKQVVGVEALVRWNNPNLGLISPDKFIPIAEDTGMIIEIGFYIFKQSCIDFLAFKERYSHIKSVSINISTVQLYQKYFIEDILKITEQTGISPELITLEITETHIMKNVEQSTLLLEELKDSGFKISIDDFGTGYSSLSYLKLFPINELKIDKSFVDNLPQDKNDVAIVKSIIALSKAMGYVNVAEGIENEEQELFLQQSGCQLGQGYHFCKPIEKEKFISFLEKTKN